MTLTTERLVDLDSSRRSRCGRCCMRPEANVTRSAPRSSWLPMKQRALIADFVSLSPSPLRSAPHIRSVHLLVLPLGSIVNVFVFFPLSKKSLFGGFKFEYFGLSVRHSVLLRFSLKRVSHSLETKRSREVNNPLCSPIFPFCQLSTYLG